jgi:hypothetical protein
MIVHNLGLFSNFADGLVFKDLRQRMPLTILATAFTGTPATPIVGTVAILAGQSSVIGDVSTQFLSGGALNALPANTYVADANGYVYKVNGAPSTEHALNFFGTPMNSIAAGGRLFKLTAAAGPVIPRSCEIGAVLNTMFPVEQYFYPSQAVPSTSKLYWVTFEVSIPNSVAVDFLTASIDAGFTGNNVNFSVAVDIEFTPALNS